MALRKPLVVVDGQVQQLQAGDTLDAAASNPEAIILTNGEASPVVIGQVAYMFSDDTIKLAEANAIGTMKALALVADASIAAANPGAFLTDGILAATTDQWDVVTGDTGGLVVGTVYYLSPTVPGGLTATAPITVGHYVVPIGEAISTTELRVEIERSILL